MTAPDEEDETFEVLHSRMLAGIPVEIEPGPPPTLLSGATANMMVQVQLEAAVVCAEKMVEALSNVQLPSDDDPQYRRGYRDGLLQAIELAKLTAQEFTAAKKEIR